MTKPQRLNLKNGLPVILVKDKAATSVTIMVFVRVGSRYEDERINGASHFIEHLMFKGTKRRPSTMLITKELDRYGAEYNAFTSKDMTAYYIKIDKARTALAIDLLHDMLFHSLYRKAEMDRERGVIVEEINMYEDNPRMHIDDLLEEALFTGSSLGRTISGPRDVVRNISRQQLIDYRDRYYIPSRMTIAVAGAVSPELSGLLEKTFGKVKQPASTHDAAFTPFVAPAALAKAIKMESKKTEQVQLAMAFHGLPHTHKDIPAAILLATILGGSMSSRLFMQVRERLGLCYSISASHQAMEDTGMFYLAAGLEKTRVAEAINVIWQELQKTITVAITADELRRAKDHIRGKLMLSLEDSASQAEWYGRFWLFEQHLWTPEERLRRIEAVRAKDIKALAAQIFRREKMAGAVIGPYQRTQQVEALFHGIFGS